MRWRYYLILTIILSALGWAAAFANEPTASTDKAAREVVGSGWFGVEAPASATTFTCFTGFDSVDAGVVPNALFPWYATVKTTCTGRAYACWLQDASAITVSAGGLLTDSSAVSGNGTDGRGPCWEIAAGLPDVHRNMRQVFQSPTAVGRRSGACVNGSAVATGRPCDADGDCTSGDTCDLAADRFPWTAGAYLCVTSVAGTAISCSANTEVE